MEETFNELSRKSQTLSSWSREQVDAVNRLKGAWDRLQSLLQNHQHIIAKQMEMVKTTLNIEKENLEKEIERFSAKWEQIKPKPHSGAISGSTIDELVDQMREIGNKKTEWIEVKIKKDKLLYVDYFNIQCHSKDSYLEQTFVSLLKKILQSLVLQILKSTYLN